MAEKNPNLEELSRKLDYLLEKQAVFQKEIYFLQKQMEALKTRPSEDPPKEIPSVELPASPKSTSATTKAPEKLPEYKKPVKPAWLMKSNL